MTTMFVMAGAAAVLATCFAVGYNIAQRKFVRLFEQSEAVIEKMVSDRNEVRIAMGHKKYDHENVINEIQRLRSLDELGGNVEVAEK